MNIKNIFKWIGVLPAGIGGLIVGSMVVSLLGYFQNWFIGSSHDSGYLKIFQWVFSPAAGGALAVYWATLMAPFHKKIVATVFFSLILIVGFSLLLSALYTIEEGWFWPLLASLSMSIGAGTCMYQVYEDENFI